MMINIPEVAIPEPTPHWKVGDNLDENGGEVISQIALVFIDDMHFQVRLYSETGREIMTTPGLLDTGLIKANKGEMRTIKSYREHAVPTSKRRY